MLDRPFAPLMSTTLPALSWAHPLEACGRGRGEDYGSQPVGTGPYRVASFTPKGELVLQRFEEYGGASSELFEPFFDEIVLTRAGDASSIIAGLSTGELDVADFPPPEEDRITEGSDISAETFTTTWYTWIGMNVTDPVLSDVNVRRAIRLAVDVPRSSRARITARTSAPPRSFRPRCLSVDRDAAPTYERNVEEARRLLADAGVGPLQLKMRLLSDPLDVTSRDREANLAEVDIDVELRVQDEGTFFAVTPEILAADQLVYVTFASFRIRLVHAVVPAATRWACST